MSNDVKILNGLISTLIDSADGYEQAASINDRPNITAEFHALATQRRAMSEDFKTFVRSLGGTPEDDGSYLAAAHRQFLNLKSTFQDNAKAAIGEVETGESYIKEQFEKAIKDGDISAQTRSFVDAHWTKIAADHARMDNLKTLMAA